MRDSIVIMLVVLAGCGLQADDDGPQLSYAEQAWVAEALPIFETACTACHWQKFDAPPFLAGTTAQDIRQSALSYGVVDLVVPEQSHVLTIGLHSGPSLTAIQTSKLLYWIRAEADEIRH
jgi:hypothetical protein